MTKVHRTGSAPRRLLPVAAAAVVAVATAAAYPAQGAAARHAAPARACTRAARRITPCACGGPRRTMRSRFGSRPATPPSSRWISATTGPPTSASRGPRSRASASRRAAATTGCASTTANGAFTNAIPTRIDGGPGNDTIAGGAGRGDAERRSRQRHDRRQRAATTSRTSAPATTRSSGTRATAATRSKATTARTPWCSTVPPPLRRSTCRQTGTGCGSSATRRTSRWTPTESSRSTSTRSAAPTRSRSTT